MAYSKGIVTGHFIAHWGVPGDIRPRKLKRLEEFAVLEFGPRGARTSWRYATNGMSSCVQAHPDQDLMVRSELYACTRGKAAWVDDLLAALATYPIDHGTYLAEGDTISVGQPIDRSRSGYTGVLLAPPDPYDPPTIGLVSGLCESVLVHQVVGLFENEIRYAKEHGGKTLWRRIVAHGQPLLDLERKAVMCAPGDVGGE